MSTPTPRQAGARPRILLLSPFLYGDKASNGGAVLCWAQLKQLASRCDLAFLGFSGIDDAAAEAKHRTSLEAHCQAVVDVPLRIGKPAVLRARLGAVALRNPELASLCRTPAMADALRKALLDFRPDVVWIQFPQMASYVELCGDIPCVMDVQDAYTLSGFRHAQSRHGGRSFRVWLPWVCWARYEARHYARFGSVLTLSEQDAQVLRAMNPAVPASVIGLPLGSSTTTAVTATPNQVGFAGSFGHQPNLRGLAWFLQKVWPRVVAARPSARFVVAGRNPPESLTSQAGAGVEFAGFVPDIFDFYASNAVTVVPLISGGGVKIKTVEAMLAGAAVVSTRIGAEGTGIQPGTHALVEDDPEAFAGAVVRALSDDALRTGLGASALALAKVSFSSEAWLGRAMDMLEYTAGTAHRGN